MTEPEPDAAPHDDGQHLSRRTTPTWEVELLIAGVAVFAMLRLPVWLNTQLLELMPRLGTSLRAPVQSILIYADAASVILAITFIAQLLLRAQWIALVGMHSVFPDGVRWDKLKLTPITRAVERARNQDPQDVIERADNRATIVFALGVNMASILIGLCLVLLVLFGVLYFALSLLWPDINGSRVFIAIIAALFLPWSLALLTDRILGQHLQPDGRLWRFCAAILHFYARLGIRHGNSVTGLLNSHFGERRTQILIGLAMLVCMALASFSIFSSRGVAAYGSYALFPAFNAAAPAHFDSAHYDDTRDLLRDPPVPYVPSAVVRHAWLRLTVPYWPARDIAAQRKHCPDAVAAARGAARDTALLACLAALHPVLLDGQPLAVDWLAGSDARTDRPALVAMIDVRALAPGRHVLSIARTPRVNRGDGDPATQDVIDFWR